MTMLMGAGSRWSLPESDPNAEARLRKELDVSRVLAQILVQRGYAEPEAAERYLNPSLDHLHDPALLPDYHQAVKAIMGAKERNEKVFVFGDYDVDGITSATLLYRFLSRLGLDVVAQVPERRQGYGIQESSVVAAQEAGAHLFLSCDCGSTAVKPVAMAREAGMTVVVTDHHEMDDEVPDAHAVVNPHRRDSVYPFKGLSGVGVVFKLCLGMARELGLQDEHFFRAFLDLAAMGTVVDVMPLVDENRAITKFGLPLIEGTKKIGLRALLGEYEKTRREGPFKVYDLSFGIGPRLNAMGRVSDAANALRLLTTDDTAEASKLAATIEATNQLRRQAQEQAIQEATEQILEKGLDQRNVIVVMDPCWGGGIVGIVASKLVERFRRPVFVGTMDEETGQAKASARSISAFHLAEAIHALHPLVHGGGHAMAAGVSFHMDQLEEFQNRIDAFAGEFLTSEDFLPVIKVDALVQPGELTDSVVESFDLLEPCGMGNPGPVMGGLSMRLIENRPTKNDAVRQFKLQDESGRLVQAVTFSQAQAMEELEPGTLMDVAFTAKVDRYFPERPRVQWTLQDFRVCEPEA